MVYKCILGLLSVAYNFWVTVTLNFTFDLVFYNYRVWSISGRNPKFLCVYASWDG